MSTLWLALDATSPVASAAIADSGGLLAEAQSVARGGRSLLQLVDDVFRTAGRRTSELGSIVAVSGPGSFTGVRVTLATAMGLAPPGLGNVPSLATISSLAALALQAPTEAGRVLAIVDALRGEWFMQPFERRDARVRSIGEPTRQPATAAEIRAATTVVAFAEAGVQRLHPAAQLLAAAPLAGPLVSAVAAGVATAFLTGALEPIYLRAPAVTLSAPPRS